MAAVPTPTTGLDAGRAATTPNGRCSPHGFAANAMAAAARRDVDRPAGVPRCRYEPRDATGFFASSRQFLAVMSLAIRGTSDLAKRGLHVSIRTVLRVRATRHGDTLRLAAENPMGRAGSAGHLDQSDANAPRTPRCARRQGDVQ